MIPKKEYQKYCKIILTALDNLQNALESLDLRLGLDPDELAVYLWDSIQNNKSLPNDYDLGKQKPPLEEIFGHLNTLILSLTLLDGEFIGVSSGSELTEWFKTEFISNIVNFLCSYNQKSTTELVDFVTELENIRGEIMDDVGLLDDEIEE